MKLFELWQIPMFDEISGEKSVYHQSNQQNNYVTIIKNNRQQ